ncbi:MAG: MBL fold metallo-hydrolase [Hyphomicrobiaceae bacterium]|nr:MBL fold metallo-hydrolase [Hyphomicrobiaceae bacterium]
MRIALLGGFGEKGRTSLGVEAGATRLIIDVGINTSATGVDYYPAIEARDLSRCDAIVITHSHEDHVGALGWCLANGFSGRVLMTAATRADAPLIWSQYALPHHRELAERVAIEPLPCPGETRIGTVRIRTGRNGHIAGGAWLWLDDGVTVLGYCGDCVPHSSVFVMDPPPPCDLLVLDASYADDSVSTRNRAAAIVDWVRAHPACVLPAPLQGRPLELMAILDGPLAIHVGMRRSLATQIESGHWLATGAAGLLRARLDAAADWTDGEALPDGPLLCHDGMGIAGPSRAILTRAGECGAAVLFTGHLPDGSPGQQMLKDGRAHWLRLPTHPNLPENQALIAACRPRLVLGHSAEPATMQRLAAHMPLLRASARTGDRLDLVAEAGPACASS